MAMSEKHKRAISEALKGKMPKFIPNNKGIKRTEEFKKRISRALRGRVSPRRGTKLSEETKERISMAKRGENCSIKTRRKLSQAKLGIMLSEDHKRKIGDSLRGKYVGERSYSWNPNREEVKRNLRNDGCKLKDKSCFGYNIVHHIKSWRIFIKLRYKLTNGIVLCQFHHPRKRIDEQRMMPVLQELVEAK